MTSDYTLKRFASIGTKDNKNEGTDIIPQIRKKVTYQEQTNQLAKK
jgi:hypothetical protein